MTQPIENMIAQVAVVVGTVSGLTNKAPTYPPEQINYSPFAITYLTSGNLANGPTGTRMDLMNVAIDVLIPIRILDQDLATLTPFLDTVPSKLQAEVSVTGSGQNGGRFAGSIETFRNCAISYIPSVDYAGVPMRGYRFIMEDVKILVNT